MALRHKQLERRFLEIALLEREDKMKAVADELSRMAEPQNLSNLLDEFVECTYSAAHHHTDSYRHDNGFDKILLFGDPQTKMNLRLHIWYPYDTANATRPRQNVHNHRWDFSSTVLMGYADHVLYRFVNPEEDGEEFFHYRYYARGSKEHYEVEGRGTARLICIGTQRVIPGNIYSVGAEILHRVDIPSEHIVSTLVMTHENIGWVTNDLLSERSFGSNRSRLPSPAMTKEEVVEKVRHLRQQLDVS